MPLQYLDKEGLTSVWGKIDSLFSRKSESGSLLAPPSNSELQKYLNGDASSLTGNEPIIASNLSTVVQYVKDSTIIYSLSAENDSVEIYNDDHYGSTTIDKTINPSLSVNSAIGGILYDDGTQQFTVPKKSTLSVTFSGTGYVTRDFQGQITNCAIYISVPNLISQFTAANLGTLSPSISGGSKELAFSLTKSMTIPSDNYKFKVNLRAYGKTDNYARLITHTFGVNNFKINISSV